MSLLLLLSLFASAQANELPERPAAPVPVPGECFRNYGITKNKPLPKELTVDLMSASCSAVAVPLSDYTDLLATEQWAKLVSTRYQIDTAELTRERDWYKARLDQELQPKPWIERPATQRWLGRIETIVIVGVVTAGLGATYHYASGAGK